MTDEKEDFGSTTAILEKHAPGFAWLPKALRSRLTPAVLGSAVAALAIAIGYVVNAKHDISHLKETVAALQQQRKEAAAEREQDRELLHKIDKAVDVMGGKVDTIALEVDRQREWRDRIEGIAETSPHARRRPK